MKYLFKYAWLLDALIPTDNLTHKNMSKTDVMKATVAFIVEEHYLCAWQRSSFERPGAVEIFWWCFKKIV